MIPYEEAKARILEKVIPLPQHDLRLSKLPGRFLADLVAATDDLPGFDNSAVDGFGVAVEDVCRASLTEPVELRLTGVVQAGDPGNILLTRGNAIKILTGAPVPPSVDAVVMKEFCEERNGHVLVRQPVGMGDHIRRRGEEYKMGQEILPAGCRVTPPVVGLLATLGFATFPVFETPAVAVIGTGNELVRPGRPLDAGQIYDSNTYALVAAVKGLGIETCRSFLARDDADSTRNAIKQALRDSHVVITAGGVSVGDYDIVKEVLEECGVSGVFWKIAIKPGRPVYFGTLDPKKGTKRKLVFGLPGNPVSALVTFHQLVRPALLKMMGATVLDTPRLTARLVGKFTGRSGRLEFARGILSHEGEELVVRPAVGQFSHMLGGLSQANCLIFCPESSATLAEGDKVTVELLGWSF